MAAALDQGSRGWGGPVTATPLTRPGRHRGLQSTRTYSVAWAPGGNTAVQSTWTYTVARAPGGKSACSSSPQPRIQSPQYQCQRTRSRQSTVEQQGGGRGGERKGDPRTLSRCERERGREGGSQGRLGSAQQTEAEREGSGVHTTTPCLRG